MASIKQEIRFTGDTADLRRQIGQLERSLKQLDRETMTTGDRFAVAGEKMQRVGATMTRNVTLPLAAIGVGALKASADFDDAFAKIRGLVGVAADEVEGMRERVLELGGETGKSPQELADALFTVTSAGQRGEEALSTLEMAAKASAAGMGDTRTVAEALTSSMAAYASEGLTAAEATDILAATARAGNFEASQLAGGLGKVLPVASTLGVELEDVGGAVGLLTRQNNDATQSLTQIQALLNALLKPSAEASKALEAAGSSMAEVKETLANDGLVAALAMLDDKLGGNREQLARVLGSSEAVAGAFTILDADAQSIEDTFGAVGASAGTLDEAFGAVEETSGHDMRVALAEGQAALIEIGDVIGPVAARVVGGVGDMVGSFGDLDPEIQTTIITLGALAAAAGPVTTAAGKILTSLRSLTLAQVATRGAIAGIAVGLTAAWQGQERNIRQATERIMRDADEALGAIQGLGGVDVDTATLDQLERQYDEINANLGVLAEKKDEAFNPFRRQIIGEEQKALAELGEEIGAQWRALKLVTEQTGLNEAAARRLLSTHESAEEAVAAYWADVVRADAALRGEAEAHRDAATAADEQTRSIDELVGATLAMFNTDLAYRRSINATEDAVESLTEAQREHGTQSEEYERSLIEAESAVLGQAAAAAEAETAHIGFATAEAEAAAQAQIQIRELGRVRDTLAKGNPLRAAIDGWIQSLEIAARPRTSEVSAEPDAPSIHGVTADLDYAARDRTARIRAVSDASLTGGLLGGADPNLLTGGPVPGPPDAPRPILAHGGEFVLSRDVVDAIKRGGKTLGLGQRSVAPGPPTSAPSGGGTLVVQLVMPSGRVLAEETFTDIMDMMRRDSRRNAGLGIA